ncbi:hypothetical protein [Streptomyces sp. CBMA123]|uniref:hypothetical protein n=1 Tax=Streptomyces sp. CBMA123 TaxID=1896313 RepID=UPI001662190F|nr:hypothetical protein [Streptomyces sp. CBMA123]MBD0692517.1 hypothetical protein [Streptomyces sp. CBMA123]
MTTRDNWIAWGLGPTALAALLAYAAGWYASRSGGPVVVEHRLNRPVLLLGPVVVLLVVSAVTGTGSRGRFAQLGLALVLVPVVVAPAIGAIRSWLLDDETHSGQRKLHCDHGTTRSGPSPWPRTAAGAAPRSHPASHRPRPGGPL